MDKQIALNKEYTKGEIYQALKEIGTLKDLMIFKLSLIKIWSIVGEDVSASVIDILKGGDPSTYG